MADIFNFSNLQTSALASSGTQLLLRLDNSLSGSSGFSRINTLNFEKSLGVYTTVQTNSSTNWNYQGSDIKALTGNWQNTYTSFSSQSANNLSVYSTVQTNSGKWSVFTGTVSAATFISTVTSTAVANYRFNLVDASRTIIDTFNNNTYYGVPNNNTVAFPTGTQLTFVQGNKTASNYTILSSGAGVTINSFNASLSLAGNYAAGTLIKTGTDTWYLIGNLK